MLSIAKHLNTVPWYKYDAKQSLKEVARLSRISRKKETTSTNLEILSAEEILQ